MKLKGKTIISTRPQGKSVSIQEAVEAEGGKFLEMPMIQIHTALESDEIRAAIEKLDDFDWVIFTGANGIRSFFEHLKAIKGSYSVAPRVRFATIGEKSAEVLESFNVFPDYINTGNTGQEFAEEMFSICNIGEKVLLPTGNLAKDTFKDILEGKTKFTRVNVYTTTPPDSVDEIIQEVVYNDAYDYLIFTSPSGIDNFMAHANDNISPDRLKVISIGMTTTAAIQAHGIVPVATADTANAAGIIKTIMESA